MPGSEPFKLVPSFVKAVAMTDWRRVKELWGSVEFAGAPGVVLLLPSPGPPVASSVIALPYTPLGTRCLRLGRAETMEARARVVKEMNFIMSIVERLEACKGRTASVGWVNPKKTDTGSGRET